MKDSFYDIILKGKKGAVKAAIGALVVGVGSRLLLEGACEWAYGKGVDLASKKWFKVIEILDISPEQLKTACRMANDFTK